MLLLCSLENLRHGEFQAQYLMLKPFCTAFWEESFKHFTWTINYVTLHDVRGNGETQIFFSKS